VEILRTPNAERLTLNAGGAKGENFSEEYALNDGLLWK
jgi:hypothetical protein